MSKIKIILIIAISLIRVQTFAISQEQQADEMLRDIIETFATLSPAQQQGQLEDAGEINDDIDNTELQNENEQIINSIYLRLLRYGIDSLGEVEKNFINTLAPQCPYVGGSAVYKARTLNYYLEPGSMYDDMKVCNAVGVYKQGNSNTSNSNGLSLITKENVTLALIKPIPQYLRQNDIMIYPNPANDYVDVNYESDVDAIFKLYNAIGEVILIQKLSKEITKRRIKLNNIANGIYHYEVEFANKLKSIGKITISN